MTDETLYRSQLSPSGDSSGSWRHESPRPEISARFCIGSEGGWGDETGTLQTRLPEVAGGQGKWILGLDRVVGGSDYQITVRFRARGVDSCRRSVYVRLLWQGADGAALSHDRQKYFTSQDTDAAAGPWSTITGVRTAPTDACEVELQLVLAWAPGATVCWGGIECCMVQVATTRQINVASVYLRPRSPTTTTQNVEQFCDLLDAAGRAGADLCVLPEAMTLVSVADARPVDVAEVIPGPTSARLGEYARQGQMYVVACYPERDGADIYNTAILLDRQGHLIGKYRKTHLPNEEVDAGYTPGMAYPVFDTDFGRVGLMICWDVAFPEPARALALAGAEIILMPIWGGNEVLMSARAIENAVYLVSSSYAAPTGIIDPLGNWQAVIRPSADRDTAGQGQLAMARVDLADRKRWDWVGDFSQRLHIERRADLPVDSHDSLQASRGPDS